MSFNLPSGSYCIKICALFVNLDQVLHSIMKSQNLGGSKFVSTWGCRCIAGYIGKYTTHLEGSIYNFLVDFN